MQNARRVIRRWFRRKPKPLPLVIVGDIALTGLALLVFAYFHHVMPREMKGLGEISARPGAVTVTAAATVEATIEATYAPAATEQAAVLPEITAEPQMTVEPIVTPDPVGYFGTKFADKFIEGEPQTTNENGIVKYVSSNVNITGTTGKQFGSKFYVADIYVRDISNLSSGLASNKYGSGLRDWAKSIAAENNAIVAVNGDYYGARSSGVVIRNGVLYRDKYSDMDVCVLYWDGTMVTYSPDEFDADSAMEAGAYQAWCFGPGLLGADGSSKTKFNTSVGSHNPRTAIGYFEPGHYCLVVVDGRSSSSDGMLMSELSEFMSGLGCVAAYNLDGGQTSVMTWGGKVLSVPYNGGRKTSDIIMVTD